MMFVMIDNDIINTDHIVHVSKLFQRVTLREGVRLSFKPKDLDKLVRLLDVVQLDELTAE